jgi:hypothetical protein
MAVPQGLTELRNRHHLNPRCSIIVFEPNQFCFSKTAHNDNCACDFISADVFNSDLSVANIENSCFVRERQIECKSISQHANPEYCDLSLAYRNVLMHMNKHPSRAEFNKIVRIARAISRNTDDLGREFSQPAMLVHHAKV